MDYWLAEVWVSPMSEKKDKKVYNYTKALNQPIWFQKITDNFSLPVAIKMSTIVWTLFFSYFALRTATFLGKITPAPFAFWFIPALALSFYLAVSVSDFTIDKKPFLRFIGDYVKFYRAYAMKKKGYFINDGLFYPKPYKLIKKEENHVNRK